jgi:hypothetical protein
MTGKFSARHEMDPSAEPSWIQRSTKGWRFGIVGGAVLAFIVFAINLSVTIVAMQ